MSFTLPYIFKNGVRKKKDYGRQSPINAMSSMASGSTTHGDNKEQPFPTLASMIQSKITPDPSPTSSTSTSSRSRPTSTATNPAGALKAEELEDNRFYRYIRSHFNLIFSRSAMVCVPHSTSLQGFALTKDFVETHSYNLSPYYRGQYQAANGKVIMIEYPTISTVSGFKEPRTVYIITEEPVYIGRKQIKVILIDRPLEGDPLQQQQPEHQQRNGSDISIPSIRFSKTDYDFLTMFPENTQVLQDLQSDVHKFVDTYVYIRGFNTYTVNKIQSMYTKTYVAILQRNKLLEETCWVQTEHDHFLELVENVVMGFLHEKIWIHSLRSTMHAQDTYLESICAAYAKESIPLSRYAVSPLIAEMPLHYFESAITCLRRVDPEADTPLSVAADLIESTDTPSSPSDLPAFTPLEKLACLRTTLDIVSTTVTRYVQENSVYGAEEVEESPVTTDEMIPLLAYVLVHSRLSRIASLVFYMEHFRLSRIERSEHSFVLVTLKSAIEFLKGDPLGLHDASSGLSSQSATSNSPVALSPKLQALRTRSTSFGSPVPVASSSTNTLQYRSISMSTQPTAMAHKSLHPTSTATLSANNHGSHRLRHRKSHSEDLHGIAVTLQHNYMDSNNGHRDEDEPSSPTNGHRSSPTPSVVIRPPIVLPNPREVNRQSLDIPNDWMIRGKHHNLPFTYHTHSPALMNNGRHVSVALPRTNTIGYTRPLVSTTFPTISTSTPLPGTKHEAPVNVSDTPSTHPDTPSSDTPSSTGLTPVRLAPNATSDANKSPPSDTLKLARSQSSRSSLYSANLNHPPEIIDIRDGGRRPASICIDPRSMHRYAVEDEDDDLMGDFLRGLQGSDGDVAGEGSGSYRTLRRL